MNAPKFDNSYARLPAQFYTKAPPTPVAAPSLLRINTQLAEDMGLDADWLGSADGIAMLAGNTIPSNADPLAQVYAGHQFGGWSPRLGDGRANLLGEVVGPNEARWDIQLKGAGRTPYSRSGDGRSALGPVIREYIVSEAMAALGIPTTRALAAVTTGETVLRETGPIPGGILTRVASSHIRVGTFQYFASQRDLESIKALLAHAIQRHYPDLEPTDALGFLRAVTTHQAELIAKWMGLGFIHGVMNTDNCHVGGITIDYGPCAFMDAYHPATVFSSIDQFGRYAYQAQPEIIVWNLAQLATSLLPLIDDDTDAGVEAAQSVLHGFGEAYTEAWKTVFFAKLGLDDTRPDEDIALVQDLLARMTDNQADFTLTFRMLSEGGPARDQFVDPTSMDAWEHLWKARNPNRDLMLKVNPAIIPRNHRIEEAIQAADQNDYEPFHRLSDALTSPFDPDASYDDLRAAPLEGQHVLRTFCGT
ncbi:MAG: protein adenylyltransferase SelO [Litoreibacter sp.]